MEGHWEEDEQMAGAVVPSQKPYASQELSLSEQLSADFHVSPQVLLPYIAHETEAISFADAREALLRALRARGTADQSLADRFLHLDAVLEHQLSLLQVEEELLLRQRLLLADVAAALEVESVSVAADAQGSDWRDAAREKVERYEAAKLRLARIAQRWAGWSEFGVDECAPYVLRATLNSVMSVIRAFSVIANLNIKDEQLPNEKFSQEEIRQRWSDLLDAAVGEANGGAVGPAALKRAVDALKKQDDARRRQKFVDDRARKKGAAPTVVAGPQQVAEQASNAAAQQQPEPPADDSLRKPRSPTPPPPPHASNASTPPRPASASPKPLGDSPGPSARRTSPSPQPPAQLDDNPLADAQLADAEQAAHAEPRARSARENRTVVQTYHEGRSAASSRRRPPAKRGLSPDLSQLDADDENAPLAKPPKRAKQVQPPKDPSDDEGAAGSNDAGGVGGGIGQREEEESGVEQASRADQDRPPAAGSDEAEEEDEGEDEGEEEDEREEEDEEPEAKETEVEEVEKGLSDGETSGTQVSSGEGEQALHAQVKDSSETSPASNSATDTNSHDPSKRLRIDAGVASTRAKSPPRRSPPHKLKLVGISDAAAVAETHFNDYHPETPRRALDSPQRLHRHASSGSSTPAARQSSPATVSRHKRFVRFSGAESDGSQSAAEQDFDDEKGEGFGSAAFEQRPSPRPASPDHRSSQSQHAARPSQSPARPSARPSKTAAQTRSPQPGLGSSDELGDDVLDSDELDSSTSPRDRVRILKRRIVSLENSLQAATNATLFYRAKYHHYRAKVRSRGISVSPTDSSADEGPPGPASASATRQDAASPEMRSQTQRVVKLSLKPINKAAAPLTEDRTASASGDGAEKRVPAVAGTAKATASPRAARPLRPVPSLANSPTRPTRRSAPAPAPTLAFTSSKRSTTVQQPFKAFKPPGLLRPPRSTRSPPRNPPAAASLSAFTYAPALPAALATAFDANSLSPDLARLSIFHEDAPALNWFVCEKLLDMFSESDACAGLAGMFEEEEEDDQVKFGDFLSSDMYDWDDEDERRSREWTVADCRGALKGWIGDFGMFKEIDVVSAKGKTWTVRGEEVAKRELERALQMVRDEAKTGDDDRLLVRDYWRRIEGFVLSNWSADCRRAEENRRRFAGLA